MGFENVEGLGGEMGIEIPTDPDGYLGRACPEDSCLGVFKIRIGTGLEGDGLPCYCAYCGHEAPHDQFFTQEQIEYATSVAMRAFSDALRKDLKGYEFDHKPKPGTFGIGISMKLQPSAPIPLHQIREPDLETEVTCVSCSLEYAVFGIFAFCPDCGEHNSLQMLGRNLALVQSQLTLAESLDDPDLARRLLESSLEGCVSALDGYGRERVRVAGQRSTDPNAVGSVSFQNLTRAEKRLRKLFGVELSESLPEAEWTTAQRRFMQRHLIAHRAGVVDQKYIDETGDSEAVVGRRLAIRPEDVRELVDWIRNIGTFLDSEFASQES